MEIVLDVALSFIQVCLLYTNRYRLKVKCLKCGVLIDKDHVFCEYCGFKIKERATVQEEHPTVKTMEKY